MKKEKTFLDFDYSLLGANSTELFIAFCRPSIFIAVIDFIIRKCFPWSVIPVAKRYRLRDYACCVIIIFLTPWNLKRWQKHAPKFFNKYCSSYVDQLIDGDENVVIISFGNKTIIEPMLKLSKWKNCDLLATPLFCDLSYFDLNKTAIASRKYNNQIIGASTFITDSDEDQDLLNAVQYPIKIEPQGKRHEAADALYIPLRYTIGVKYPRSYAIDQFLFVDSLILTCAFTTEISGVTYALVVASLMMISMMCIYEIGYHENDTVAASKEFSPTLTALSNRYQNYPIQPAAWLWALATGASGIYVASKVGMLAYSFVISIAVWTLVLLFTRLTFYIYNKLAPVLRIYVYALLQVEKSLLIFIIIIPNITGALLASSHAVAMWFAYVLYRLGAKKEKIARDPMRFVIFCIITGATFLANPTVFAHEIAAFALIFSWSILRLLKTPLMQKIRRKQNA